MGTIGSQQSYSFAHQFQLLPTSNHTLNLFHLHHKQNPQLFLGKQLTSNDQDETYQIECILHQKTINPSPFVTKLIRFQSYYEDSYCSTSNHFYLLYRSPPRRLSDQIKSRVAEKRPFHLREIDNVISRISKGIKYLYDIYHNHCYICTSSISWPVNNSEEVQLIDPWVLPIEIKRQKQQIIYRPKDDEKINEKNLEKANDLLNLGLVAKQMMQVENGQKILGKQPGYREVMLKIQTLTSQVPFNRFIIYNMINSFLPSNFRPVQKVQNIAPTPIFQQKDIKIYPLVASNEKTIQNFNKANQVIISSSLHPKPKNLIHYQDYKRETNKIIQLNTQPSSHNKMAYPARKTVNFKIVGKQVEQKNINTVSTGSLNNSLSNSIQKNKYIVLNQLQMKHGQPKEFASGDRFHVGILGNTSADKTKIGCSPLRDRLERENKKEAPSELLIRREQNLYTSAEFFQKIKSNLAIPVVLDTAPQILNPAEFQAVSEPEVQKNSHEAFQEAKQHSETRQKEPSKTLIHENVLNINIPITQSVDLSVNQHQNSELHHFVQYQTNFQVNRQFSQIQHKQTPVKGQKINQPFSTIQQVSERSGSLKSDDQKQFVIEQYENGSRYEGYKKYGMRNGKGKFYYQEGSYFEGEWKNNNMHGNGKLYYSNNKIAYEGQWYMDQFHGKGKVYNDDPSTMFGFYDYTNFENVQENWKYYEGNLVEDSKEGIGKLVLSNDEYYEGQFKNDKVDGSGRFVTMNGQVIKGIWRQSKLVIKL